MVLGHAAARRPAVWPLIKLYPLSLGPGFVEDPTLFFPVFLSFITDSPFFAFLI